MIVAVVVAAFFAGFGMGMIYGLLRGWRPGRQRLEPPSFEERVLQSWRCQEDALVRAARELLPRGPSSRRHPIATPPAVMRELYALHLQDKEGRHMHVLDFKIVGGYFGGVLVAFHVGRFEPHGTIWLRQVPDLPERAP